MSFVKRYHLFSLLLLAAAAFSKWAGNGSAVEAMASTPAFRAHPPVTLTPGKSQATANKAVFYPSNAGDRGSKAWDNIFSGRGLRPYCRRFVLREKNHTAGLTCLNQVSVQQLQPDSTLNLHITPLLLPEAKSWNGSRSGGIQSKTMQWQQKTSS